MAKARFVPRLREIPSPTWTDFGSAKTFRRVTAKCGPAVRRFVLIRLRIARDSCIHNSPGPRSFARAINSTSLRGRHTRYTTRGFSRFLPPRYSREKELTVPGNIPSAVEKKKSAGKFCGEATARGATSPLLPGREGIIVAFQYLFVSIVGKIRASSLALYL